MLHLVFHYTPVSIVQYNFSIYFAYSPLGYDIEHAGIIGICLWQVNHLRHISVVIQAIF